MTQFALVLHFYQPPTQSLNLTEEILRSCYLRLCDLLLETQNARVTINLSGSLLLQTQAITNHDLSHKFRRLAESGKVEFLNSPVYHPISPLTHPDVLERQLKENQKVLENFCGIKNFVGIFPPELAVNEKTVELFGNLSNFVVIDETSFGKPGAFNYKNTKLMVNSRQLTELIRSYPTELQADRFANFAQSLESPLICTTDAEVFGHHYQERINFLKDLFGQKQFDFVKLSELNPKDAPENSQIVASTWQTTKKDLENNNPFPYWLNKDNEFQKKYYQLADMAYEALKETRSEKIPSHMVHSAEVHFDKGISSCHPYWLSNLPWWHPDLVESGAKELIRCVRTVPMDPQKKQVAEKFYHEFLLSIWHHQWSGEVEKKYQMFDKMRQDLLRDLPQI